MERFILEYSSGDYGQYCDNTVVVVVESEQQIVDDINRAIPEFAAHNKKVLDDYIIRADADRANSRRGVVGDNPYKYLLPVFGGGLLVTNIMATTLETMFPDFQIYTLDAWCNLRLIQPIV